MKLIKIITLLGVLTAVVLLRGIYVPWVLRPDSHFLYASGPPYYAQSQYAVEGGFVKRPAVEEPRGSYFHEKTPVRLFVYDVAHDDTRQITYVEAAKLKLLPADSQRASQGERRSNGFLVSYGRRPDPTCGRPTLGLCPRNDYDNVWLEGWTTSRRLGIEVSRSRSFEFLGWIDG